MPFLRKILSGSGFYYFKSFLESLEIRFPSPFLWPTLTLSWFLVIEVRFRKRLFRIESFKKIRYNSFFCLLTWQGREFVERGRFGTLAQLSPWFTIRLSFITSLSRTEVILISQQSRQMKLNYETLSEQTLMESFQRHIAYLFVLLKFTQWMQLMF